MANDIANIRGTTIRVGSVVVKAPKKSATSNNTIANRVSVREVLGSYYWFLKRCHCLVGGTNR